MDKHAFFVNNCNVCVRVCVCVCVCVCVSHQARQGPLAGFADGPRHHPQMPCETALQSGGTPVGQRAVGQHTTGTPVMCISHTGAIRGRNAHTRHTQYFLHMCVCVCVCVCV